MLEHTGQTGHADMLIGGVDDVLIHLVCDDKGIVLQRELCDGLQLIAAEDLAAGVRGVAEDQRLGPLCKALFNEAEVKLIGRRDQRDIDGFRPGEDGICAVVFVKRREDHDLITGVADGHHRGHHGLGAAAGDADLGVGVHFMMEGGARLFRQCFAEILGAEGHGVLVRAFVSRLSQCVQQFLRRVKIREPLRQIDGVILVVDTGHTADDGVGKRADTIT